MDHSGLEKPKPLSILWFRHGLRIHDNPALLEALKDNGSKSEFMPIFIFDGESAGTKICGYNRFRYLLESLQDLDLSFRERGGSLRYFRGNPVEVFKRIHDTRGIHKLCFEQDCEPIWTPRDTKARKFCKLNSIPVFEYVSHTLWNPSEILEANGGNPPLTYAAFQYVVSTLGPPPRPMQAPPLELAIRFCGVERFPGEIDSPAGPEVFGIDKDGAGDRNIRHGGERFALQMLEKRLELERAAFQQGLMLPNHANPDLMTGMSLSPALRFGNVSVRRFYWGIQDLYDDIIVDKMKSKESGMLMLNPLPSQAHVGQLYWREYFYVMSVPNPNYDKMKTNPICLNIPWLIDQSAKERFDIWKQGKTGYPFVDAAMRQLLQDGWLHHVTRNAVACFLTRGDLWVSWEEGLKHFLKYLLDADWSVCAGNWMWVSSSAFENILDCTHCVCPTNYAQRLDPDAVYIKRYLPELQNLQAPFIFEPWKTPLELQKRWGCIIGQDYPRPMVDHSVVSRINRQEMLSIRKQLQGAPAHPCPSDTNEARQFMWLPENCGHF